MAVDVVVSPDAGAVKAVADTAVTLDAGMVARSASSASSSISAIWSSAPLK